MFSSAVSGTAVVTADMGRWLNVGETGGKIEEKDVLVLV